MEERLAGVAAETQSAPVDVLYLLPPEQPGEVVVMVTSGEIVKVTGVVLWATVAVGEAEEEPPPPPPPELKAPLPPKAQAVEVGVKTTVVAPVTKTEF